MYIHTHLYMYIHTYIYIYIFTYAHTYVYIYICTSMKNWKIINLNYSLEILSESMSVWCPFQTFKTKTTQNSKHGVPIVAQWKQIWLVTMRLRVRTLALLSGLRIRHCHELWCRSQAWLGSCIAVVVAQAGSCSSDSNLSPGTSICCGCSPKKQNKTKQTNKKLQTFC